MYIDNDLEFSDAQAITDASAASTDYLDTLADGQSVAPGARVRVAVETAFAAESGAPTLQVSIQTDDNVSFSSPTTLLSNDAKLAAALTDGEVLMDVQLPIGVQRYIRLYYTLGGTGAFNAGKVDGHIVLDTNRTMDRSM